MYEKRRVFVVGDLQKIKPIVKHAANWVIRIMGSLILLILVRYAMTGTQYMLPVSGHEFPVLFFTLKLPP